MMYTILWFHILMGLVSYMIIYIISDNQKRSLFNIELDTIENKLSNLFMFCLPMFGWLIFVFVCVHAIYLIIDKLNSVELF